MPLKTDPRWEAKILSLKSDNPRMGEIRIQAQLEMDFARGKPPRNAGEPPSTATVRRIIKREWDGMTEEERASYRSFHWPESFERGDLPWEASRTLLAFLRLTSQYGARPSVRECHWYWQMHQAAPDAPPGVLDWIAQGLVDLDVSGALSVNKLREVEGYLAFRGWDPDSNGYSRAVERGTVPRLIIVPPERFDRGTSKLAPTTNLTPEWLLWMSQLAVAEGDGDEAEMRRVEEEGVKRGYLIKGKLVPNPTEEEERDNA